MQAGLQEVVSQLQGPGRTCDGAGPAEVEGYGRVALLGVAEEPVLAARAPPHQPVPQGGVDQHHRAVRSGHQVGGDEAVLGQELGPLHPRDQLELLQAGRSQGGQTDGQQKGDGLVTLAGAEPERGGERSQ